MPTIAAFSARISRSTLARYAVAFLATLLALLARRALTPFLGDYVPYITLFPAVAFSAWFCGLGPSILTIALALLGARYWFTPPVHASGILDAARLVGAFTFLFASGVIVAIGEVHRRSTETLRRAQGELEGRVKRRTTELDAANQNLRELTARLLQLQDEERRRIARELHDSVGQTLAALIMNLSSVGADIERLMKTASIVTNSAVLVREMNEEIRTISYLLHPPLLDELGLSSALRWYIEGFAERGKIKVDLDFPDDFGRLSQELETAIFRMVQECLTNIHRHSESPIAKIRIARSGGDVRVEVEDRGKGMPPEKQSELASPGTPGVGIRGMRERIAQLGGSLEIHSNSKGTVVAVRLPVVDASQSHRVVSAGAPN
ncbi:MAG: sensor histidine kinase [Candidatus Acidiferrales bacterium]